MDCDGSRMERACEGTEENIRVLILVAECLFDNIGDC